MGRDKNSPTVDLTEDYLDRARSLARGLGMDGPHLKTVEAPRGLSGPARQDKEASLLTEAAIAGGEALLFDERGKDLSSRQLADFLANARDAQGGGLSLFIGGADGFLPDMAERLSPRPVRRVAFGKATWPHLLVRTMAAEQLYRAMTLLAGHPYHRD